VSLEVQATRTPLAPTDARELLGRALAAELGRTPAPAELRMVVAQSALETNWWKALWNWNFGNATAISGAPFFVLQTRTGPKHFRPFASAWQGATYFVALLRRRYASAWQLLGAGDPIAYAYALKAGNYYEEDPAAYGEALAARYRQLGPSSTATEARNAPAAAGTGAIAVALFVWWWYQRHA
jgi:hypothetical protein